MPSWKTLASSAAYMPVFSLRKLFLILTCLAIVSFVVSRIVEERRLRSQAVQTGSELAQLRLDFASWPGQKVTLDAISKKLELPEYGRLRSIQIKVDLLPGEVAWFEPNRKYRVGIRENARIIYIVNGTQVEKLFWF